MVTERVNMRLLAAVMFADMVGYTKLMQEDEDQAKKLRDHQRKVIDPCIIDHHGQRFIRTGKSAG